MFPLCYELSSHPDIEKQVHENPKSHEYRYCETMPGNKYKKTVYHDNWSMEPDFHWASKVEKDIFSCYCSICKKNFSLSNMGRQALISHMKGKKHMEAVSNTRSSHSLDRFLQIPSAVVSTGQGQGDIPDISIRENPDDPEKQKTKPPVPLTEGSKKSSASSGNFIIKADVTRAELIWCLTTMHTHISISAAGKCVDAMKRMFTDSGTAAGMKLQRTKISYIIVYGLGPYFRAQVEHEILQCQFFSVAFDESLNKVSQKEQLDIMIRFWSCSKDQVVCRYFGSAFLGHTTSEDLLSAFKNELAVLDLKKMVQVSMDGPNVNLKFLRILKEQLLEENPLSPVMFDLGSCGLHIIHNAFKCAMKSSLWKIVEFLRAIYNVFKNVPARRADYFACTGSTALPRKFCAIRWLQNVTVAQRAIEILPNLKKYVKTFVDGKKSMSPSLQMVADGIDDKFIGAKLAFFESVASEVEPFLTDFQSEAPMAPFIYTDLTNILRVFMRKFVKKDVLEKTTVLTKIDVNKSDNIIYTKDVDIGYGTREALRQVAGVSDKDKMLFKRECQKCLQTFCSKIIEKSALQHRLTKGISFCDPFVILNSPTVSYSRLKSTLEIFVHNKWITGQRADIIDRQFKSVCTTPAAVDYLKDFTRTKWRLDDFWKLVTATGDFGELLTFLKMIFVLSHGNASVERGFSVNKECLIENQLERSLISQRYICDALNNAGGIENIEIDSKMIHAARNARSLYMEALDKQKKERLNENNEKLRRKRAAEAVKELVEKKKRVLENAQKEATLIDEQICSVERFKD